MSYIKAFILIFCPAVLGVIFWQILEDGRQSSRNECALSLRHAEGVIMGRDVQIAQLRERLRQAQGEALIQWEERADRDDRRAEDIIELGQAMELRLAGIEKALKEKQPACACPKLPCKACECPKDEKPELIGPPQSQELPCCRIRLRRR